MPDGPTFAGKVCYYTAQRGGGYLTIDQDTGAIYRAPVDAGPETWLNAYYLPDGGTIFSGATESCHAFVGVSAEGRLVATEPTAATAAVFLLVRTTDGPEGKVVWRVNGSLVILQGIVWATEPETGDSDARAVFAERWVVPGFAAVALGVGDWKGADLSYANMANVASEAKLEGRAADWTGVDLQGANLSGWDLTAITLDSGVNLRDANLSGVRFKDKQFLDHATLVGVDLSRVDLRKVRFATGADFTRANLADARLDGLPLMTAILDDANLTGATLSATLLPKASLLGTNFTATDLTATPTSHNFSRDPKRRTVFHRARLRAVAIAENWSALDLSDATIEGLPAHIAGLRADHALLNNLRLDGIAFDPPASFDGSDLTGVSLKRAGLKGAGFKGATLSRASLTDADATTAVFDGGTIDGAMLDSTIQGAGKFDHASFVGANLTRASLARSSARSATFDRATLTKAILTDADATNAVFDGGTLEGAMLDSTTQGTAKFDQASFIGANLTRASLARSSARSATLDRATLTKAILTATDLTGAKLVGGILYGASLSYALLASADLTSAQLGAKARRFTLPANVVEELAADPGPVPRSLSRAFADAGIELGGDASLVARIPQRNWVVRDGSDIHEILADATGGAASVWGRTDQEDAAVLAKAYMPDAVLTDANLYACDLSEVQWYGAAAKGDNADFEQADFSNANLGATGAGTIDLSQARLFGARLDHAILVNVNLDGAYLSPSASRVAASLVSASLQGTQLLQAHLDGATLTNAAVALDDGVRVFTLPVDLAGDLDLATVSAAVSKAFAGGGYPLLDGSTITVVATGQRWTLCSGGDQAPTTALGSQYATFSIVAVGNALTVSGASLWVTRLASDGHLATVAIDFTSTKLDSKTLAADTTCPNGEPFSVYQEGRATWDAMMTAPTPPTPPACIPDETHWCPAPRQSP